MAQIFHRLGHMVRTAEDGFAALTEIRDEQPDVILSDLNMPNMSGFELLSVVRRRFPGIQVVAMSGAFSGESIQPGVAADAFYEKASGIPALLEIIDSMADPKQKHVEVKRASAPFWIQMAEDDPSGQTEVTISCPECLRTFPQEAGVAVGNINIHNTICVHCSTDIQFAIVRPSNATLPQAFQNKSAR
jgi:CheY-like chemotaxis protein